MKSRATKKKMLVTDLDFLRIVDFGKVEEAIGRRGGREGGRGAGTGEEYSCATARCLPLHCTTLPDS